MILSYDKNCNFNPDVTGYIYSGGLSNSASCLAGVFDWNGGKSPNKLGKDVITLGVASGLGSDCAFEIGDKCFSAPFSPTPLTQAECESRKDELGIKECLFDNDYWAGAVAKCGGVDKMPTQAELIELAKLVYNTSKIEPIYRTWGIKLDTSVATTMGFSGKYFYVWSGEEDGKDSYGRAFYSDSTMRADDIRSGGTSQGVCSSD